jgi:hypothetical protein
MKLIDMLTGNWGATRQETPRGGEIHEAQSHDLRPHGDGNDRDRPQEEASQAAAPYKESKSDAEKAGHHRHGCC